MFDISAKKLIQAFSLTLLITYIALLSSILIISVNYQRPDIADDSSANTQVVSGVFKKADKAFVSLALALSSDGWFVSLDTTLGNLRAGQVVLSYNNQDFLITKIIRDKRSDIMFLKIDTQVESVPRFAELIENDQYEVAILDEVMSSESYPYILKFKGLVEPAVQGSIILDSKDRFVGMVQVDENEQYIIPATHIKLLMSGVLQYGSIRRPLLGVKYTESAKGALIVEHHSQYGPAGRSGLRKDDIIIKVDNTEINDTNNLSLEILDRQIGSSVIITYLRNEEEFTTEAFLGIDE